MLNRGNFRAGLMEGIKGLWNLHSSLGVQKKKSRKRVGKDVCACILGHVQLFCDPMDCSLPDSSVYGISQARLLEWVVIPFCQGSLVFPQFCLTAAKFWSDEQASVTTPCYSSALFANKGKCILEVWGWANPKDTKRREAQSSILAPLFICVFLLPLSLPYVNWASQEGCLFYLDLLLFYVYRLFPFCLLATAILNSLFLF